MLLPIYKKPAKFTVRFKVTGIPFNVRDPLQEAGALLILNGQQSVIFHDLIGREHLDGTVVPLQVDEPMSVVMRNIRKWLVAVLDGFSLQAPTLVIEVLEHSFVGTEDAV